MKLGVHVSAAGQIDQAVDRAVSLGCNTFQIFVSNPRGWKPTIISAEHAELFKTKYDKAQMQNAFAHSIYLINLASPNEYLREQGIESLISGLINTEKLGLDSLVTHVGSHQGDGIDIATERVVYSLGQVLGDSTCCANLLLENTAGAGNLVGKTFVELGNIINKVNSPRLGVCLDTAHAFEYGYKINTAEGLESLIKEIEDNVGLDRLKAIHLNDSMTECGSNKDRHETFGEGKIGKDALTRIINHPKLRNIPFVMETPEIKSGEAGREIVDSVRALWI
ncbi:MAG: deoxyribonuclease IV [bacterium]